MVLENLFNSRRFWLAVVTLLVTGAGVAVPAIPPTLIDAFQKFAAILIAAFTVDDTAQSLHKAALALGSRR